MIECIGSNRNTATALAVALAVVLFTYVLSATYLYITKICRSGRRPRCGTLKIISNPKNAKFNIVAVHGLGAHPEYTWIGTVNKAQRPNGVGKTPPKDTKKAHLLKGLLKVSFPEARILSFEHNSNWLFDAPVNKTMEEIGESLLGEVKADMKRSQRLPIIFLGHSLGGIVIKQALCGDGSREIIDRTSGIIFLGTPHEGLGSNSALILSLMANNNQLSNLKHKFERRIAPKRKEKNGMIISFYETKQTYLLKGIPLGRIVSKDSALAHMDDYKSIDTDHSGLNKCAGKDDELYYQIKEAIKTLKEPSLLDQADECIQKNHYDAEKEKVRIERLSGETLSMDQCYISLAIMDQTCRETSGPKEKETKLNPFTLVSRQNIDIPDKSIQVELRTLFNRRRGRDGHVIQPRRIFIQGCAGTGKTTLCKKIIHEYSRGTWSEWSNLFTRILWVPLRNLKRLERRRIAAYNFEDLFTHEYFSLPEKRSDLAKEVVHAIKTNKDKTLFLLDGLDEVSDVDGDMGCFLQELLNQHSAIITSRLSVTLPEKIPVHVELETVGFYPDQVRAYLCADPKMKSRVDEVQAFLDQHWIISGLVRIPILLDALCYTWNGFFDSPPTTMTSVYQEIELKLWKKDVEKLNKKLDGEPVTASDIAPSDIERIFNNEIRFLEGLAFTGLYNNVALFTPQNLNTVSRQWEYQGGLLNRTLRSLSFLRTSDPSSDFDKPGYHFIHLTFEEYFAARYFARQWIAGKPLKCLKFGKRKESISKIDPLNFLKNNKYKASYDIFWRFVAGLLEEKASDFFTRIEEEPFDLLGPAHQRLIMHCLSELSKDFPKQIKEKLEQRLSEWLLFECGFGQDSTSQLASEAEIPIHILVTVFSKGSDDIKAKILMSLRKRAIIPPSIVKQAASWLEHKNNAPKYLCMRSKPVLYHKTLISMAERIENNNRAALPAVIKVLGDQLALSPKILGVIAGRLEDKDWGVRLAAIDALGKHSYLLSDEALMAITARLEDEESHVQRAAIKAFGETSVLPDRVVEAITTWLENKDWNVPWLAVVVPGRQPALSDEVYKGCNEYNRLRLRLRFSGIAALKDQSAFFGKDFGTIARQNEFKHYCVRLAALNALGCEPDLSERVLEAIVTQLKNKEWGVQWTAMVALGCRLALSNKVLEAVAAQLENEHYCIRLAAINALGCQSALSNEVLEAIVTQLEDEDGTIKRAAINALGCQPALPNEVLEAVVRQLEDENKTIKRAAINALGCQSALPNEVLEAVVRQLEDEDESMRRAAIEVLVRHAALFSKGLKAITIHLEDKDKNVRCAAIDALGRYSALPNVDKAAKSETFQNIAIRIGDRHNSVRKVAISTLGQKLALPDTDKILAVEVLKAIATGLKDNDDEVRQSAIKILHQNSSLLDADKILKAETLKATLLRLEDKNWTSRLATVKALGQQATLNNADKVVKAEILHALAARLEDKNDEVRKAAIDILFLKQKESDVIRLKNSHVTSIYKDLLWRSFREQWSWCIYEGKTCIHTPEGTIEAPIGNSNDFKAAVEKVRPANFPAV